MGTSQDIAAGRRLPLPPTAGAPSLSAQWNAARLRPGATTPAKTPPLPAALDAAGLDEDPAKTLPPAARCALASTGLQPAGAGSD